MSTTLSSQIAKWIFVRFISVEVKAVINRQPLLGTGPLPDWLRRKRDLVSLDTYDDNICLFRCLAVHRGARLDRSSNQARQLSIDFWGTDKGPTALDDLRKIESHFKLGIRVYEPVADGLSADWILRRQPAHYDEVGTPSMTIGIYNGLAFLIKDIKKLANQYLCGQCNARFTKASNLTRHADRCQQGQTEIVCRGEQVEAPESAFEKTFYSNGLSSCSSIQWLESEARARKTHIHHALRA